MHYVSPIFSSIHEMIPTLLLCPRGEHENCQGVSRRDHDLLSGIACGNQSVLL